MRISAPPLVVLSAALLLGCSRISSGGESLLDHVADSAQASEEQGTVRFVMRTSIDDEGTEWDSEQTIEGGVDFKNELLHFVVDDESLGLGEIEAIFAGGTVYIKAGELTELLSGLGGLPEMPQWLSMELGDEWSELFASGQPWTNPGQVFAFLKTSAASVSDEGSEEVRGVTTTHYVVVIDTEAAAADESLASSGVFGLDFIGAPEELSLDVWIDDDGLVRRMEYAYESDGETRYSYLTEFFDYGEPLDVAVPSGDDVMDIDEWVESLTDIEPAGGGFGWEDPFEGADCYGDRMASCFEPNPELQDLYADPDACNPAVPQVCLVPVGYVRRDVVETVLAFHRDTAGIEIKVLPSVAIDPANVDFAASQGRAESIFEDVKAVYGLDGAEEATYIGLTSIDLRPDDDGFGWYFGFRHGSDGLGHVHGMFSYFRMANVQPYDGGPLDDQLLFERVSKYAARYVALLHLKWPPDTDIDYVNYYEMYGFSDLDSMGMNWPEGEPPCLGDAEIICIVPDGLYFDDTFEADVRAVLGDLERATGVRVELRLHGGAYPTWDPWSDEYLQDLYHYMTPIIVDRSVVVIGVTDDPFADEWDLDLAINPHITKAWPNLGVAVASGFDAGTPGTDEHRERMFRLLLRAVLLAQGTPESDDPKHLLYSGHDEPADLDAVTAGLP